MKKFISIALAVATVFTLGLSCFADVTTTGGSGTTPVKLSSTDGTNPAATAFSVAVPTSLPVTIKNDGTITTATNVKITNNSYGPVRVKSATIAPATGWTLVAYGNASTLANAKVDSKKFGFAMTLGTGTQVKTTATTGTQTLISAPTTGCYMAGKGDSANNSIAVAYSAITTAVSTAITDTAVANVVFTIEWDTAA